jgi:N-acetyl-anhydromuramyl-L-alanine amidase AmpD
LARPAKLLTVVNKIDECEAFGPGPWREIDKRNPDVCEFVVLHRIQDGSPEFLAEFFSDPQWKTGRRMPYHFVISSSGVVSQCVSLSIKAPGAIKLNPAGIQVALEGDFRKKAPSVAQALAVADLVTELLSWKPTLRVVGHTDSAGASNDANKICPGKHLVPANVKLAATALLDKQRAARLLKLGIE